MTVQRTKLATMHAETAETDRRILSQIYNIEWSYYANDGAVEDLVCHG